ncbi:META domain-containing protein [Streptomyces sp. NPDC101160]|uniref:META domain-containing protein n=1 Tax=Streptomyces sp. NPDC101160 TaxID=3366118 RepID=UPI00381BF520
MKKPRALAGTALTLLLPALAACGGSGPGAGTPDVPVAGTHWTIGAVTVDGVRSAAPSGALMDFTKDGRVQGTSGCNGFDAAVAVRGDALTVSDPTVTAMGCPDDRMRFEDALLRSLKGEITAKLKGGALSLTSADGRYRVELTAEPATPLLGTAWTVDALISGDTSTSLPAGSEGKARLVFGKDGRLTGSLGCNRVSAPAKAGGSTITLGAFETTRMICTPAQMDLETKLYDALDNPLTYRIEHRTLTVTDADGQGFTAKAG